MLDLPKSVYIDLSNNPVWTNFHWDNQQLQSFPWFLEQFTALSVLSLNRNRIPSIPSFVSKFTALETLSMKNNSLREFPAELALLTRLIVFHANGNPVSTSLTWHGTQNRAVALRVLGQMNKTLEDLDVSFGQFTMQDVEVMLLYPRLVYLNASHNQMKSFHPASYTRLNVLDISFNPIIDVKEDVFFSSINIGKDVESTRYIVSLEECATHYSVTTLKSYFERNMICK